MKIEQLVYGNFAERNEQQIDAESEIKTKMSEILAIIDFHADKNPDLAQFAQKDLVSGLMWGVKLIYSK